MLARVDDEGRTLAQCVGLVGGRPKALEGALRVPGSFAMYLELHIEQGPILEREGIPVGIVTGISRWRVTIEGRPDHAGGTPMAVRKDALCAAAEVILALEALWKDGDGVGMVGRLSLAPNAMNVVPGSAELLAEMRSIDGARLDENRRRLEDRTAAVAARRGVAIALDRLSHEEPVQVSATIQDGLADVVGSIGQPVRRLPSYAGHDGNQIAKIAPIGMLFVPSRDGRSHCPEEWTDPEPIVEGVRALASALVAFDREPPGPAPEGADLRP